jgi:signal peptidase I
MGDNRSASNDSRYFGAVRDDQIIGRAWFCYWPLVEIQLFR